MTVEAFVAGEWCELDAVEASTIERAICVYCRATHPVLGEVWVVPREHALRGDSGRAVSAIVVPEVFGG